MCVAPGIWCGTLLKFLLQVLLHDIPMTGDDDLRRLTICLVRLATETLRREFMPKIRFLVLCELVRLMTVWMMLDMR